MTQEEIRLIVKSGVFSVVTVFVIMTAGLLLGYKLSREGGIFLGLVVTFGFLYFFKNQKGKNDRRPKN